MSSHGQVTGYFIGPDDYEEFKRFREQRHSFRTEELSVAKIKVIAGVRMNPRHGHLDALLESK